VYLLKRKIFCIAVIACLLFPTFTYAEVWDQDPAGSYVSFEEGRIVVITQDSILNRVCDPESWEIREETSYRYTVWPTALTFGRKAKDAVRILAVNENDGSDLWILYYDPAVPDDLIEEFKADDREAPEEPVVFSRAENQ